MKLKFNYHTHSQFCDGSSPLEEYVKTAIEKEFTHLGFSGHAPMPFENNFAIHHLDLDNYCNEVLRLKEKYSSKIKLYLSMEIDFIPGVFVEYKDLSEKCKMDYIIGAVHLISLPNTSHLWFIDGSKQESYDEGLNLVFKGDIKQAVKTYYKQIATLLTTQNFDILAHFDKVKMHNRNRHFSVSDKWYQDLENETLELIKAKGCVCEVNTRGLYKGRHTDFFPSTELLKQMRRMNIPVTISTDAHNPSELDNLYRQALNLLKELGFGEIWYFEEEWKHCNIDNVNA